MEINETNNQTSQSDANDFSLNNKNDADQEQEHDIIILDDDDFIQTTLNLFNPVSGNSLGNSSSNGSSELITALDAPQLHSCHEFASSHDARSSSILIDLTTCDDFDLNDIFLMSSGSNAISFDSNNRPGENPINMNEPDTKLDVKNEFKVFNFNFSTCMDEILIDDDDDEINVDLIRRSDETNLNVGGTDDDVDVDVDADADDDEDDEENDLNENRLLLQSSAAKKQRTSKGSSRRQPLIGSLSSPFLAYRSHDSSSESSSTKKSSTPPITTNSTGNLAANGKSALRCDKCSKTFNKLYNYKRHLFTHEASSIESVSSRLSSATAATGPFKINECPKCKKRIVDKSNFAKHLKICIQKSISNKKAKIDDTWRPPPSLNHRPSGASKCHVKFQCEICLKWFNKKFNYHRHIRMHFLNEIMNHQHEPIANSNSNSSALESNCQETFPSLTTSNSIITSATFYECDKCPRKFNEHKQLLSHRQKWHMTENECTYCGQKYTEKLDYIRHLNFEHSVRFKFECKHCHRTFKYMSQYVQHKQTHRLSLSESLPSGAEAMPLNINQPNRNKCHLCGKVFSKTFNLKRHINTRHSTKLDPALTPNSDELNRSLHHSDLSSTNSNRLRYECNLNQKNFYECNKINFHLNKFNFN